MSSIATTNILFYYEKHIKCSVLMRRKIIISEGLLDYKKTNLVSEVKYLFD